MPASYSCWYLVSTPLCKAAAATRLQLLLQLFGTLRGVLQQGTHQQSSTGIGVQIAAGWQLVTATLLLRVQPM